MSHKNTCVVIVGFLSLLYSRATCQACRPLHLTPYLVKGQITSARNLSLVFDKSGVIPTSHAGFITADKRLRNHLFFWFFPALNGDPQAPLLVWLNGGPGVTSMFGLFHENGPLKLKHTSKGSIEDIVRRNNTWAEQFSMLYIDNPVGVGYSYSESGMKGYRATQNGYTKDLHEFMKQFYKMFPEYLRRELYIGGQSYAGKYVPALAYEIHTSKSNIPLTGIYLGAPFIEPITQIPRYFDLHYALGYISFRQKEEFEKNIKSLHKELISGRQDFNMAEYTKKVMLNVCGSCWDNWATLEILPDNNVNEVMRNLKTQVHACDSYYTTTRKEDVIIKLSSDILQATKQKLAKLMDKYKVLIYTGDQDGAITSPMVEATLMSTPWSLQSEYNASRREAWTVGGRLVGFYSRIGRFCRVTVRGAGHQTPHDQPDNTLLMMSQFIRSGCVKDH